MKSWLIRTFALLAIATAAAPVLAAPPEGAFMSVDEIRPGMKGIGKTVFLGTQIEDFDVEIIGVLEKASADGDIILAKTSGGPLAESGIIRGMSGSPVYIDGKLIGALAFSWSFSKQPIAGITPIGEMLEVMARTDHSPDEVPVSGEEPAVGPLGSSGRVLRDADSERASSDAAARAATASRSLAGIDPGNNLAHIATPVSIAGFDSRTLAELVPWLEQHGFAAATGGGGGNVSGASAAIDLEPGAAVGVQLVTGDASVTGIGTVTYRDGNRIIAFGHPFFQAGDVDFPMTGAYIHGVLPSALSSFKLGSPLDPLGTLTQDRRVGIAGNIGPQPKMMPVTVTVRTAEGEHTYKYGLVRDKRLTPELLRLTAMNSVMSREAFAEEKTIATRTTYRLTDGRTLTLENLYAGFGAAASALDELAIPAELLIRNRFERVGLESIDMAVDLDGGRRIAHLEAVVVSKNPVRPGETITVSVQVREFQGTSRIVPIEVTIPAGTPNGDLTLKVCDAGSLDALDLKRAPLINEFHDLDTFLKALADRRRNDYVYAQLETPDVGVSIDGREMPSIPRSVFSVIDSERHNEDAGVVTASVLTEAEAAVDVVVTGCNTLSITVDDTTR